MNASNPSLKESLIELVLQGRDPDVQNGIHLSLEFLESVSDPTVGVDDLRLLLERLQAEESPEEPREENLADFQYRHDQEIIGVTSAIEKIRTRLTSLEIRMTGQEARLERLEK